MSPLFAIAIVASAIFGIGALSSDTAPSSLLFPPSGRRPESKCDFDDLWPCDGWMTWQSLDDEMDMPMFPPVGILSQWPTLSSANFRIRKEKMKHRTGVIRIQSLEVNNFAKMYLVSDEVKFQSDRNSRSICFSFYYRIKSHHSAGANIRVYILAKSAGDIVYKFEPVSQLVSNITGKWPSTWNWLINNVQQKLPSRISRARVVFFLDSGAGSLSLDDIEIFNTSCNLRPAVRTPDPTGSNGVRARTWPSANVTYNIRQGFSPIQRMFLVKMLEDLNHHTCLNFVPKQMDENESQDFVEFVHTAEGCTSQRIGYYGGKQRVHLSDTCFDKSTISHELLHIVGLFHEHQRPDRDDYIEIITENIHPAYTAQFKMYQDMDERLLSVPYDYRSVMHYRDNAFAKKRGLKTMKPIATSLPVTLGNIQGPSLYDYRKIANLYCDGEVKSITEAALPASPPFRPNLWDKGEIPIDFSETFTDTQRIRVLKAIDHINSRTCVKFRQRRPDDEDYVFFDITASECFARSGKMGGRQVVSMFPGSCFANHLIYWLLLHVVGLDAEHRRPDRDVYIKVHVDNIPESHRESFQKFESIDWRVLSVPYDITSILHYSNTAFGINKSLDTLTSKKNQSSQLGNKHSPSLLDYAKILRLYECSYRYWKGYAEVPVEAKKSVLASKDLMSSQTNDDLSFFPLLWERNRIPFVVNENQFTISDGRMIVAALLKFNSKTCLNFVPRKNESDFVEFVRVDDLPLARCRASYYGRKGGRQHIFVNQECLNYPKLLFLALIQTAGIPEEHRRPDRDDHIHVMWGNIQKNAMILFQKYNNIDARFIRTKYDINSITHFSGYAFSKQIGLPTMYSKKNASLVLGNDIPSHADFRKISNIYCQ